MAGSTNYPTSVDVFVEKQDGIDIIRGDDVNDSYAAIEAEQTFIGALGKAQSWATDLLKYLSDMETPRLEEDTSSQFTITAGAAMIKNAAESVRLPRINASPLTVTASHLDTGSMALNTTYYVFIVADASGTGFTQLFSLSSTSPTGATQFELIGAFFNESAGALDVTSGYIYSIPRKGRRPTVSKQVEGTDDISTNGTSFALMDDMVVEFYSDGIRPTRVYFNAPFEESSANPVVALFIESTQKRVSTSADIGGDGKNHLSIAYQEVLSEGFHTIEIQWKVASSTVKQNGSTDGERTMIAEMVQ